MNYLQSLYDIYPLIKYCIIVGFLYVITSLTACGVSSGNFVAGTTSYLKEHNAGKRIEMAQSAPMDAYTPAEKKRLSAIMRRY